MTVPAPRLGDLLVCAGCGHGFYPSIMDRTRVYRSLCGCRLRPVDAERVDRRVRAEVARVASTPVPDTPDGLVALAVTLFARVVVGATADDIHFDPGTAGRLHHPGSCLVAVP